MLCANCEHGVGDHSIFGCQYWDCDCLFGPYPSPAADTQIGGSHYQSMPIQPWQIIDAFGLGFYEGSALKYLLRAGRKGSRLEDWKKCRHYLDKMIELEEGGE